MRFLKTIALILSIQFLPCINLSKVDRGDDVEIIVKKLKHANSKAKGSFTLLLKGFTENIILKIYGPTGKQIFKNKDLIHLSNLPAGKYLVVVNDDNNNLHHQEITIDN